MSLWKQELESIIATSEKSSRAEREQAHFEAFLADTVIPAFEEIATEMKRLKCDARVRNAPASAFLSVYKDGVVEEIAFSVVKLCVNDGILPQVMVRINRNNRSSQYEESFRPDGAQYTLDDIKKDEVITLFLRYYRLVKEG